MTTATPSSLNLEEKKRLWNEYKYDTFEEISKDKSTLFNYFITNNDIFRMIAPDDQIKFRRLQIAAQNQKSTAFFGSLAAVFVLDQIVFKFALPNFRIPRFRFMVNFAKYVIVPCTAYTIYKDNFMNQYILEFYRMQEKYNFGFEDYMKANRIFERALTVDRLEELRERRHLFDWRNVPPLPEQKPIR